MLLTLKLDQSLPAVQPLVLPLSRLASGRYLEALPETFIIHFAFTHCPQLCHHLCLVSITTSRLVKMSRLYNCKKCKTSHSPPTERRCQKPTPADKDTPDISLQSVIEKLAATVTGLAYKVDEIERQNQRSSRQEESESPNSNKQTARSLQNNTTLQREVRARIADLDLTSDSDDDVDHHTTAKLYLSKLLRLPVFTMLFIFRFKMAASLAVKSRGTRQFSWYSLGGGNTLAYGWLNGSYQALLCHDDKVYDNQL